MRVLGLMSGTSADGVDAVLVSLKGSTRRPRWRILASASVPYPTPLRQRLIAAGQGQALTSAGMLELSEAVSEQQAEAARRCDPQGTAELIGCHGQTLWHRPPQQRHEGSVPRRGASLQLLQAPLLAALRQTPVVFDFRAADLALGGQGAPLVPPVDAALLGRDSGWRAVLNLGGIANLTLIPPARGPDRHAPVLGWDCGPANSLIDLAVQRFSAGRLHHDAGGSWAAAGQADEALIKAWLQHPYLQQPPPKSTGRELFGLSDLEQRLGAMAATGPADVLATLTAFTAACIAQDLSLHLPCRPLELLVAGGGCSNATLIDQLQQRCRGTRVVPLAARGIAAQQREALAFAVLAWWHHRGHHGNAPSVTGARSSCVLGVRVDPPQGQRWRFSRGVAGAGAAEHPADVGDAAAAAPVQRGSDRSVPQE